MRIYLDTGNIDEIKEGLSFGVIDGVTTNPSLIAREGVDFRGRIKDIVTAFLKEGVKDFTVSAEVTSESTDDMIREALSLAKISPRIVVKIPMTAEGIKAVKALSKKKVRTNVTLVFSPNQALLAAKAGAFIVSPFIGRLDDIGHDGIGLIEEIRVVYDNYGFKTMILSASIRHPKHVLEAALAGSDIATIPFSVFKKLFKHPLTNEGLSKFMKDWADYKMLDNNKPINRYR